MYGFNYIEINNEITVETKKLSIVNIRRRIKKKKSLLNTILKIINQLPTQWKNFRI